MSVIDDLQELEGLLDTLDLSFRFDQLFKWTVRKCVNTVKK